MKAAIVCFAACASSLDLNHATARLAVAARRAGAATTFAVAAAAAPAVAKEGDPSIEATQQFLADISKPKKIERSNGAPAAAVGDYSLPARTRRGVISGSSELDLFEGLID